MRCTRTFGKYLVSCSFLILFMPLAAMATPKPDVSQPEVNKLAEIRHDFFDSLKVNKSLVLNSSALNKANKVYVESATVEFSKYWEREHRTNVSNSYKQKTSERFSRLLEEKISEACENSPGFQRVTNRSEADLILVPAIEELNIYAPDDFIGDSWVYRAGRALFRLQVQDANSGEVLVEFSDGRETVDRGFSRPVEANRATNTRDFRMLMEKWSTRSFEYLEELKALKN